jgi:hypothetical protein
MKSLLLISTLAIFSSVQAASSQALILQKAETDADKAFDALTKNRFAKMKGIIDGYYEGMYKNASYVT